MLVICASGGCEAQGSLATVFAPSPCQYLGCKLGRRGQGWLRTALPPHLPQERRSVAGLPLVCTAVGFENHQYKSILHYFSALSPLPLFSTFPMKILLCCWFNFLFFFCFVVVDDDFFPPKWSIVYLKNRQFTSLPDCCPGPGQEPCLLWPPLQPHQPPPLPPGQTSLRTLPTVLTQLLKHTRFRVSCLVFIFKQYSLHILRQLFIALHTYGSSVVSFWFCCFVFFFQ